MTTTHHEKGSSYLRFQVDHILNPVTALAYIDFRSRILLLTGEGPLLRIYDQSSGERLLSHRILTSHAIHGIAASSVISQHPLNVCSFRALLWGDRCISVVEIEPSTQSKWPTKLKILDLVIETLLGDWILDAQLRPRHEDRVDTNLDDAIVITAHNHLLHLQFPQQSIRDAEITICHAAKGPRSMLYSAHTTWSLEGRVLVAAGTIFGEVIVWSFDGIDISSISEDAVPGTLHYVFKGHEGSVFGVRISDVLADKCSKSAQRVVASCSDDRTIRLWDISRLETNLSWTENQETPSVPSNSRREDASNIDIWNDANRLLSKATGHSSRVWGVRFIHQIEEELLVLSFGEDATSQLWRLSCSYDEQVNKPELQKNLLRHEVVYEFNCGKNLWAIAVHVLLDNDCLIAMGGADGRIVCFSLNKEQRILKSGSSDPFQFTMPQVCKNLEKREISPTFDEIMAAKTHIRASPERLFDIFQGTWKLFRALRSALSVYPSGYFEGTAIFEQRPSTSEVYDKEYLYIENGQFTTNQGLVLMANRRYIYRYQKDVDKISVWFVRQDGTTADYLFHEVNFSNLQDGPHAHKRVGNTGFLKANGQHLCVHDDYQANYLFEFIGSNCNEWGVKYNVKGPKKDYVADNRYIREDSVKTWKEELDHEQIINRSSAIYESKSLAIMRDSLSKRLFKSYTWINENELLLSTDHGVLIWGTLGSLKREEDYSPERHSTSWKVVGEPMDCRDSCIFSTIRSHGIVHLTGANGTIFYYQHAAGLNPGIRVPGKVGYLKSHLIDNCSSLDLGQNSSCKLGIIAVCLGSPIVHIFFANLNSKFSNHFASDCRINCESDFVVTSSCFIRSEELFVLGSRNGYIIIYDILVKKDLTDFPIKSCYLRNVHGKDTVTTIEKFSAKASNSYISYQYILTTGRDGTFSIHHIMTDRGKNNELSLKFETVHVGTPPLGPNIEGSYFGPNSGQLYIWGFRNKDFVVWNETKKTEIMAVECGGPHRNWAFIPKDDGSGGNLVWTKVSTCNIYLSTHASHRVMQSGGHGREIKAMAISSGIKSTDGSVRRLIATGAEDTNIRIFGHDTANVADEEGFECLGIIVRHKTGLQQLRWSSNGQLLFSSGGCEEFFVWRIRLVPMIEVGIVCEARCPAVTDSSDLRIMNFDFTEVGEVPDCSRYIISMVYSDSSVRVSRPVHG